MSAVFAVTVMHVCVLWGARVMAMLVWGPGEMWLL